jgi:hypothetical protein
VVALPATAAGRSADTAALQVALRALHLYAGDVDGVAGPGTRAAVSRFQARRGLAVDGIAGPATRRALGRRGRPAFGSRVLHAGQRGWDVAALQFLLAVQGFPSGNFDGGFGGHVDAAVRHFQRSHGLFADGVVGRATLAALRGPAPHPPIRLAWPLRFPRIGDRYGPRGARFHAGVDLPADTGTTVRAAGAGRVVFAGSLPGWGNLVVIAHPLHERTRYAHLSAFEVRRGAWVTTGTPIGRVGATGDATGPHLHFEVVVDNANVNPLLALP